MEAIRLEAKPRTPGKSGARAARRAKEVPCILYGHAQEPVPFQVPELDLRPLIFTDEFHRVQVVLGDQSWDCFMKKMDFHPVTDRPFHGDFQAFVAGEEITIMLPIQYEGTPAGIRAGGRMDAIMHEIEVTLLPKDIPDYIALDVSALEIGDTLHVSDLPAEFSYSLDDDTSLVTISAPRVEEEDEDEDVEQVVGLVGEDEENEEDDED